MFNEKQPLVSVVELLRKNEDLSENKMAQLLNCEMSYLRNTLYQLHNYGLVNFQRKRDDEFGIYTYFWRLNKNNIKTITKRHLEEKLKRKQQKLENYQNKIYFTCENNCVLVESEQCLEFNYQCPECGETLIEMKQNKEYIKALKQDIKAIKEQLKIIANF